MGSGAKKGDNRFGEHQAKKQNLRLELLKRVLRDITKRKQVYPNESQLAEFVANEINVILKAEYPEIASRTRGLVYPTTLMRKGTRYKVELEKHLLKSEKVSSTNELRAEILTYQLEISALKDELAVVKNFAKKNLSQVSTRSISAPTKNNDNDNEQLDIRALDAAYKIIMSLVEASDGVFAFENNKIINLSKTVNNVIADEDILKSSGLLNNYLFKGLEKDD
jgi:hypothetical protein